MNLYVEKNSILYSVVFCFFLLHSATLLSHSPKKHKIKKSHGVVHTLLNKED